MDKLETENLPGGISVAAGGTRTEVKLDRPWQAEIRVDPAKCPFETKEEEQEAYFEVDGGWRVLPNRYTPYPWHKLIVPRNCWPSDELRILGGHRRIARALAIAESIDSPSGQETWLGVHIGPGAGQNFAHLHYHLIHPLERLEENNRPSDVAGYFRASSRLILQDEACKVVAGGCRAGQCFLLPNESGQLDSEMIAGTIYAIIRLYNAKFKSKQGMSPDYLLSLVYRHRKLIYGTYVPVLNNWGFTEYLGLFEERPLILPWPHEETVRHLKYD